MNTKIRPLMTEKASKQVALNVYSFEVNDEMNKYQITELLEKIYKVKVDHVRMAKQKGKVRRVGRKGSMKQLPDRKIAYVTLKEGKIDIFPQA
jgi:ribosomal protein L23